MLVQRITRRYIDTVFDVARLPVGILQLAARRGDDAAWPPRLAFGSFEGEAKRALGAFLSDDRLAREGQVEAARVADLREAVRLDAEAMQVRLEADAEFEQRSRVQKQAREQAEATAARRLRAVDQERARAEQAAAEEAERARQAAEDAAERREVTLEKQRRASRLATIEEEKAALRRGVQATRASAEIAEVDRKIQASKGKPKAPRGTNAQKAAKSTKPAHSTKARKAPARNAPAPTSRPRAAAVRSTSTRSPRP